MRVPGRRKAPQGACTRPGLACASVSFETFGKELISLARLTVEGSRSESEGCAARKGQAAGCESARVKGIRPEPGRSNPGQAEA